MSDSEWQQQAFDLWQGRWKSTLARTAGTTKRTVQRWVSGESLPHPEVLRKLDETWRVWKDERAIPSSAEAQPRNQRK